MPSPKPTIKALHSSTSRIKVTACKYIIIARNYWCGTAKPSTRLPKGQKGQDSIRSWSEVGMVELFVVSVYHYSMRIHALDRYHQSVVHKCCMARLLDYEWLYSNTERCWCVENPLPVRRLYFWSIWIFCDSLEACLIDKHILAIVLLIVILKANGDILG